MQEIIIQLVPRIRNNIGKLQCTLQIPVRNILELQALYTKSCLLWDMLSRGVQHDMQPQYKLGDVYLPHAN
jgi:hypothetical protein